MRKLMITLLFLIFVASIWSAPLRILFTNDTHAVAHAKTYGSGERKIALGGYANLERLLVQERQVNYPTLTFDSGDEHTGSAFSDFVYQGIKGGAVVEVFNRLNYDAACFGNHEFDQPQKEVRGYMQLAKYPYLCANLKANKQDFSGLPYQIILVDSIRVGVIGLIMTDLPEKVNLANVKDLHTIPYKEAIDAVLPVVDAQSDLIILLTHIGKSADSLLATQLDNRVDLILGGHSHTMMTKPLLVNGILIGQNGSHLQTLGEIDMNVENDRIVKYDYKLIPIREAENQPTALSSFVDSVSTVMDRKLNEKIGVLNELWLPDKYKETTVSKWQAKVLFESYKSVYDADFAMINNGGIRTEMAPGDITLRDMYEMVPFDNTISTFTCTGAELIKMIEWNLEMGRTQEHDILSFYPITYQVKEIGGKPRIYGVKINGEIFQIAQYYRGISHDYVLSHSDKYMKFEPQKIYDTGDLLVDKLIDYVRQHHTVGN